MCLDQAWTNYGPLSLVIWPSELEEIVLIVTNPPALHCEHIVAHQAESYGTCVGTGSQEKANWTTPLRPQLCLSRLEWVKKKKKKVT